MIWLQKRTFSHLKWCMTSDLRTSYEEPLFPQCLYAPSLKCQVGAFSHINSLSNIMSQCMVAPRFLVKCLDRKPWKLKRPSNPGSLASLRKYSGDRLPWASYNHSPSLGLTEPLLVQGCWYPACLLSLREGRRNLLFLTHTEGREKVTETKQGLPALFYTRRRVWALLHTGHDPRPPHNSIQILG